MGQIHYHILSSYYHHSASSVANLGVVARLPDVMQIHPARIYELNYTIPQEFKILVGGFNHLEKYEGPVGMIIPYNMEKNKSHVWNHQADIYIYIYIWVNYNSSPTWIKPIWGWFPLLTMIPGLGRSEVVMKFTQMCIYILGYIGVTLW